jgi:hypothetical protein
MTYPARHDLFGFNEADVVVKRYSWPNGEIWCVDYRPDGRVTREIVGNWITGEVWGRGSSPC